MIKFYDSHMNYRNRLVIRRSALTIVRWTAYLAPFTFIIWSSLLLIILIVSSSIAFTNQALSKSLPNRRSLESFGDSLIDVFGTLCNQGKKHLCIHLYLNWSEWTSNNYFVVNIIRYDPRFLNNLRNLGYLLH